MRFITRLLCIAMAFAVAISFQVGAMPSTVAIAAVADEVNIALNASGADFPAITYSWQWSMDPAMMAVDGVISYTDSPRSRWALWDHLGTEESLTFDFGNLAKASRAEIYVFNDGGNTIEPASMKIEYFADGGWKNAAVTSQNPTVPAQGRNTITFEEIISDRIRFSATAKSGKSMAFTEIEIYGVLLENLALNPGGSGYPEVTASHRNSTADSEWAAVDGIISYTENSPRNRWALWNHLGTTEWLVVNFGRMAAVSRAEICVFDETLLGNPNINTIPPESMWIEYNDDGIWKPVNIKTQTPASPAPQRNIFEFDEALTDKIRFNAKAINGKSMAFTEIEIYGYYLSLGLSLSVPDSVQKGESIPITITLDEPAPAGGKTIWIAVRDYLSGEVKDSYTIPEGEDSLDVFIDASDLADGPIMIVASPDSEFLLKIEYLSSISKTNLALNPKAANGSFPKPFTSYPNSGTDSIETVVDGIKSGLHGDPFDAGPRSRWSNYPDTNQQYIGSRFEEPQVAEQVALYIFNDGGGCKIPANTVIEYFDDATETWKPVSVLETVAAIQSFIPYNAGRTWYWSSTFEPVLTSSVRVVLTPAAGASLGISEMEIYGDVLMRLGHRLSVPASSSNAEPLPVTINLLERAGEGGKTIWIKAIDSEGNSKEQSFVVPVGQRSLDVLFDWTQLTNGEIMISSALTDEFSETKDYATKKVKTVTSQDVEDIYNIVKTDYEYGIVLRYTGKAGDYDSDLIDNANVFRIPEDPDYVYMTYVGHNGVGYQTGLARSKDYLTWERLGVIINDQNVQNWDRYNAAGYIVRDHEWGETPWPHIVPEGVNDAYTGKYVMTYLASDTPGYEAGVKKGGIAFAPSILNGDGTPTLWTRYPDPILDASQNLYPYEKGIIWKSQAIYDKENSRYVAFYNCASNPEIIAQAYSEDLINWSRESANPTVVAEMNEGFQWGSGQNADPDVVKIGDLWVMFYFTTTPGGIVDSYAVSTDMVNWTKSFKILTPRDSAWNSTYAHKPCVFKQNGIVYHYYNAVGNEGRLIALRASEDLSVMKRATAVKREMCGGEAQYKAIQKAIEKLQNELRREGGSLAEIRVAKDELEAALYAAPTSISLTEVGGAVKAVYTLANGESSSKEVLCILAVYDDQGRLKETRQGLLTVDGMDTSDYELSFTLPVGSAGDVSGWKIKAFMWDATTFAPITDAAEFVIAR